MQKRWKQLVDCSRKISKVLKRGGGGDLNENMDIQCSLAIEKARKITTYSSSLVLLWFNMVEYLWPLLVFRQSPATSSTQRFKQTLGKASCWVMQVRCTWSSRSSSFVTHLSNSRQHQHYSGFVISSKEYLEHLHLQYLCTIVRKQ